MGTYLITGIGRGIGQELAHALLSRGDRVVGTLRDKSRVPAGLERYVLSGQLVLLELDVRDGASIAKAAHDFAEPIDVLVNNAGIIGPDRQSPLDTDFEGFLETLDVNTLGPLRVTQAFLPHLRRGESPKVVIISSTMGSFSYARADHLAYRASKAAVNKVMQGLATYLRGERIVVVSVHPGWVQTDMGGAGADISPQQSAAGLIALIDRLSMNDTGAFFDWQGGKIPF